uniref:Uncharacterized protein n=1 Tax=Romanomermis culicivorax TaxID=13658 RepID=A0A915I4U3_ROMCU
MKGLSIARCGGGLGSQIGRSGWRKCLGVEIDGEGLVPRNWMKLPWDVAEIYVLHGRSCSLGSVAPEASLCAVAIAKVVLVVVV